MIASRIEPPPRDMPDSSARSHRTLISNAVRELCKAVWDGMGGFTLRNGQASTVVVDGHCTKSSCIIWMPMTANAATAMTKLFVAATDEGSFTITHDNTADIDRTFRYAIFS